jgi:hypothetical protein
MGFLNDRENATVAEATGFAIATGADPGDSDSTTLS